jgi:hypothetical protein
MILILRLIPFLVNEKIISRKMERDTEKQREKQEIESDKEKSKV